MNLYNKQETFNTVRKYLKDWFDFEPTLIELVHIKEYVKPVLKLAEKGTKNIAWEISSPEYEILTRFLHDYYDLPIGNFLLDMYMHYKKEFSKYLKLRQEREHFP